MSISNLIQAKNDYNLILFLSNLRNKKEDEGNEIEVIALENEIERVIAQREYSENIPKPGDLYECKLKGHIHSQLFVLEEVVEIETVFIGKESHITIKTREGQLTMKLDKFNKHFRRETQCQHLMK